MIRRFPPSATSFEIIDDVLTDLIKAEVKEQGNGDFSLSVEAPLSCAEKVHEGDIITAPTPRGEQPFRVHTTKKTLTRFFVSARHVFYDTANNFLKDCRPTNDGGQAACEAIMRGRSGSSPIVLTSDIPQVHTAYYVRKTELEALMGSDNAFLKVWGGYLIRDGFKARFRARAIDRGFTVELGKNLTGVEAVIDTSNVVTRVLPTFVLSDDKVYTLPETFITSPIAKSYPQISTRELRVQLTEEQRAKKPEELYGFIRSEVARAFDEGLDKPQTSFRVNFVMLSKTYPGYEDLEELDIWDEVTCKIPNIGIETRLKVSGYVYDALKERFTSMDLGDARPTSAALAKRVERNITDQIIQSDSPVMQKINATQNAMGARLTGNMGGHIVTRYTEDGTPYELLIMDAPDMNTAKYVIRMNSAGIGLSDSGINGPFNVAMDAENGIYSNMLHALRVTSAMIEAGAISTEHLKAGAVTASKLSATDVFALNGTFKGRIQADSGYIGGLTIANGTISGGNYTGTGFQVTGQGQAFMGSARAYNMESYDMRASRGSVSQMSASSFNFQSGSIQSGVTIGRNMFVSSSGIRLRAGSGYAVFENVGQAWLGIYSGDPDVAANVIWAVTTNGVVVGSDRKLKKDIHKLDGEEAINFIKEFDYYTFKMKANDAPSVGVIANFFERMKHPFKKFVLDKVESKQGAPTLAINYDKLAIINGAALKSLINRVEALERKRRWFFRK